VDVQGNVLGQAEEQVSDVGAVTVVVLVFPGSAPDELDSLSVERDVRTVEVNARVHDEHPERALCSSFVPFLEVSVRLVYPGLTLVTSANVLEGGSQSGGGQRVMLKVWLTRSGLA
jgi:hypothetical protein